MIGHFYSIVCECGCDSVNCRVGTPVMPSIDDARDAARERGWARESRPTKIAGTKVVDVCSSCANNHQARPAPIWNLSPSASR